MNLNFCGDVMLGRLFNQILNQNNNFEKVWGNLLYYLNSSDGTIGNLETTITNSTDKEIKTFNFKLNPKFKKILKIGNFKYVNIANNHILDFKEQGLEDTIKNLNSLKIKFTGAGTIEEAMKPIFLIKNGIKIGFLSAADHPSEWLATKTKKGIFYVDIRFNNKKLFDYIKKVKSQCDYLVFSIHWNYNYVDEIKSEFRTFAYDLIRCGVDIIHGHSPHHLLEIEKFQNGLIFYSLGDFIDDYAVDQRYRNDLACLINIQFTKKYFYIQKIIPTKISNFQVNETKNKNEILFISKKLKI